MALATVTFAFTQYALTYTAGIVFGKSSKSIAPKENTIRAEVAAIVSRLLQKSNLI